MKKMNIINVAVISEAVMGAEQIRTYQRSLEALLNVYEADASYIMFAGNPAGAKMAAENTRVSIPAKSVGVNMKKQLCFTYVTQKAVGPCQKAIGHAHVVIVLCGGGNNQIAGELALRTVKEANKQFKDCYCLLADGTVVDRIYKGKEEFVVEPLFRNNKPAVKEEKKVVKAEEDEGVLVKKVSKTNRGAEYAEEPVVEEESLQEKLEAKKAELAEVKKRAMDLYREIDNIEKEIKAATSSRKKISSSKHPGILSKGDHFTFSGEEYEVITEFSEDGLYGMELLKNQEGYIQQALIRKEIRKTA